MAWDPKLYHRFARERFQPFEDLLKMLRVRGKLKVVDLGCGTGELTLRLADHLPKSQVLGIDGSEEMLAQSQNHPRVQFQLGRIEEVSGSFDLIFSNAALHWVEDHPQLIPRLIHQLNPGGQLLIQMPANEDHPSQKIVRKLAREGSFEKALGGWVRESPVLDLREYAEFFYRQGIRQMTLLEKIYCHELANSDAMADWLTGSTLIPYRERLPEDLWPIFQSTYRARLEETFPGSPVFFSFRRMLLAANKPL